jgi:hypothetical protein
MSGVYTVLAVSKGHITVVETYAGVQSAITRGWHVATELASQNTDWVSVSPSEEKLPGGIIRWVFLDTSLNYVAVYFSHIEESLKSRKDRLSLADRIGSTLNDDGSIKPEALTGEFGGITFTLPRTVPSLADVKASDVPRGFDPEDVVIVGDEQLAPTPAYNMFDRTLPAGFDLNNRPILMGQLLDDPYSVKGPENLTTHQKWALVIARARKNPNWCTLPKGYSGYAPHASVALPELEQKTAFGELIMEGEISALQTIYDDAMLKDNVDRDQPGYFF